MMAYVMGQERRRSHYETMLHAAGLRVERVVPTESEMAIIEAVPI